MSVRRLFIWLSVCSSVCQSEITYPDSSASLDFIFFIFHQQSAFMYRVLSYFEPSFFVKYELLEYNGIIMWEIVVRIIWSSFLTPLTHLTHNSSRVPVIKKMNIYLNSTFVRPFWKTNLCLHVFIIQFLLDLSGSFFN